jgi:hypothetical protein
LRLAFATALALTIAIVCAGTATGEGITAGDLLVIDNANGTLDDINPTTGKGFVIASGFSNPRRLAISALGTIFVSDILTHTI